MISTFIVFAYELFVFRMHSRRHASVSAEESRAELLGKQNDISMTEDGTLWHYSVGEISTYRPRIVGRDQSITTPSRFILHGSMCMIDDLGRHRVSFFSSERLCWFRVRLSKTSGSFDGKYSSTDSQKEDSSISSAPSLQFKLANLSLIYHAIEDTAERSRPSQAPLGTKARLKQSCHSLIKHIFDSYVCL
jgi:hypothetical protein